MRLLPLAVPLILAACQSSAPYTLPAAAINTGVALGAAAAQRAAGGCYAVCTHGTACNPKTGRCEPAGASADEVCQEAPGGGTRCIPFQITKKSEAKGQGAGVVVSPATGEVPPPPAEASPRGP